MFFLSTLIYRFSLALYKVAILVVSWWNPKAQKWWNGRKGILEQVKQDFESNTAPVIWVHCASLGEFEQARPLIEQLKKEMPNYKILLTFFSPSGYEYCKNYQQADWVYYLPLDSAGNARKWVETVAPARVFFIKYEYWYFYLKELQKNKVPTYLVAAIFRPQQIFFKFYGGFFREVLSYFSILFVQDFASKSLLESIGIENQVEVVGDTRLDRVIQIRKEASNIPIVAAFSVHQPTMVAGSTWPEDEELLAKWLYQNSTYRLIIAPHEIDEQHLQGIEKCFAAFVPRRYTVMEQQSNFSTESRVLIIDNIGMLSQLYQYSKLAYIGGGFGAGIHNCLEAAVYQVPVFFGSNYQKFREAKDLIKEGVAYEVGTAEELTDIVQEITSVRKYQAIQQAAANYFGEHAGATEKIMQALNNKH